MQTQSLPWCTGSQPFVKSPEMRGSQNQGGQTRPYRTQVCWNRRFLSGRSRLGYRGRKGKRPMKTEETPSNSRQSGWFFHHYSSEGAADKGSVKARWTSPPMRSPCRKSGPPGAKPRRPSGTSPTLPSSGSTWSGQPGSSCLHSEGEEPEKGTTQVDKYQAGQGRSWTGNSSPNPSARVSRDSLGQQTELWGLSDEKQHIIHLCLVNSIICKRLILNKVRSQATG